MAGEAEEAIRTVLSSQRSYCKFLSANDSGETGGHQCGVLVSHSAWEILFMYPPTEKMDRWVDIHWGTSHLTRSHFIYYKSKNELRITCFGRGFPLLQPQQTGSLFILTQLGYETYYAYILNTEAEIDTFLGAFGLTPVETNQLLALSAKSNLEAVVKAYAASFEQDFPSSEDMSKIARKIDEETNQSRQRAISDPDAQLLEWIDIEYRLFKAIEKVRYGESLEQGFIGLDDFTEFAKSVINRRKSRAGKSLEHQLAELFRQNNINFSSQPTSEEKKTPDFLFPSEEAYHDLSFPVEKLVFLAAKTTCKDRWRQILNEADRTQTKFLCTLQEGISKPQLDEMKLAGVVLVVPKEYIHTYPADYQKEIWTVKDFIEYVRLLQDN